MPSPASANVSAGNTALATDYNNLRSDAITPSFPAWTNQSGGTLNEGALVIFDKAHTQSFTTTTVVGDRRVMGVVTNSSVANGATGNIAMTGIFKVLVQGNVAVGQALIASATAGRAQANGGATQPGLVGYAVTAYSGGGAGDVLAILHPDFGRAGASLTLISAQGGNASGGGNLTISTNLGGSSNSKLVLAFFDSSSGAGTVTFNAVAMTAFLGTGINTLQGYRILTTSSGSQNFSVSGLAGNSGGIVLVFEGHDTSSPVGTGNRATGTSVSPTVSCTDAVVGDVVIACVMWGGGSAADWSSLGSGQTEIFAATQENLAAFEASRKDATTATEPTSATLATSRTWFMASIPVHLA